MSIEKFLAYGKDQHTLETVMRLQAVKRWHMIETTRIQSLAEHSANVSLLAMTIARTAPIEFFDTFVVVAAAGLVHDIPESFTGDIPSHTKRFLKGLDELENTVQHPVFNVEIKESTRILLKICDIADGIRFIRLHGVDLTAEHAKDGLEDQFTDRMNHAHQNWPEHVFRHVRDSATFYAYESK